MKKYSALFSLLIISLFFTTVHADPTKGYDWLEIDTASGRIFAARQDKAGIDVIDLDTGETTTMLPDKKIKTIALDEQKGTITAIEDDKAFYIISTETFNVLAGVPLEGEATSLAIDSNLGLAIFTLAEGRVGFVDINARGILAEIDTLDKPVSVAVDPQLHLAVVVHDTWGKGNDVGDGTETGRDNVTIVDLVSRSIINTLQAGKNPVQAAVNPTTHEAAVANEKSNDLTLIDLTGLSIKATIPVDEHPKSLDYNECLNTLSVVGGEDKGWIQVIDINSRENEAYYDLGTRPEMIKVHQYLNRAAISGKGGLRIIDMPNPIPQLISVNPEKALRGEESSVFLLNGRGLLALTNIYLNGSEAVSTFPACGVVNVDVPAEDMQKTGDIEIRAVNPSPSGGGSDPLFLKIENPVPALSVLDPMEIAAGATDLVIAGYGTGFFDDTTVYIDGISRPFTRKSQQMIQMELSTGDLEFGRYIEMTASNPLPGGGTSNPLVFTVLNSIPELTAINPATIIAGKPDFELSLTGKNFVKTSIVSLNNQQYPLIYISRTRVEATIPADAIKTPGNYAVKVINPAPGGGETQTHIITVKPPIEVKITSPIDGDTVNQAETIVKGTVKSDTRDIGVLVNGISAELMGKEWVANGVPLMTGANTVTATINDDGGNAASSSITVNTWDTTRHVKLSANITSGFAPLTIYFAVTTEMPDPVSSYQIDFDGDGVIDYTGATFDDIAHTYTTEGFFYPTVSVMDNEGNTYSDTIAITALDGTEIEGVLREKWEGLKGALKKKDTEAAVGYFVERAKEKYRSIFNALKDQLPAILDTFVEFNIADYHDDIAEYEIVTDENGALYSYPGLFIKDGRGIWKFRDF